jgi:hypothetical protein
MAMPPRVLGDRAHEVVVQRVETSRWAVLIDGRALSPTYPSEPEARAASHEERLRLDAIGGALLRRVRRGLQRKR